MRSGVGGAIGDMMWTVEVGLAIRNMSAKWRLEYVSTVESRTDGRGILCRFRWRVSEKPEALIKFTTCHYHRSENTVNYPSATVCLTMGTAQI